MAYTVSCKSEPAIRERYTVLDEIAVALNLDGRERESVAALLPGASVTIHTGGNVYIEIKRDAAKASR